ncbi:MAG: methyltetrahydrofolate cobalamin methyltransferase [Spirochaetaceae bacterium]|jgi:5-methyltetrahydrofolate--homocysteine methyltransferase|nr:methyltetrahydrofolate cobalamin methyltransferase [Spirochaetaceae bacterium]
MILIGEKINGSIPKTGAAIAERNEEYIREIAKKQTDCMASYLDVCASVPPDKELETLRWLVGVVQQESDLPICLDSPNADVFAEAITLCKKPGIINSVSMEGDKIEKIFPVIAGTEWRCVVLLCDNTGIPGSAEKRLEVFERILEKAEEYRIAPERLYVDPVVEMLASSETGARKVLDTIRKVKARCPDVHITSGASNISFQLPLRKFINRSFIILCMSAGMDSAIVDPTDKDTLALIYAAEALLGRDEMCMEYISAYRDGLFEK